MFYKNINIKKEKKNENIHVKNAQTASGEVTVKDKLAGKIIQFSWRTTSLVHHFTKRIPFVYNY